MSFDHTGITTLQLSYQPKLTHGNIVFFLNWSLGPSGHHSVVSFLLPVSLLVSVSLKYKIRHPDHRNTYIKQAKNDAGEHHLSKY